MVNVLQDTLGSIPVGFAQSFLTVGAQLKLAFNEHLLHLEKLANLQQVFVAFFKTLLTLF